MEIGLNDEIEITIIVKLAPNGEWWKSGKLQTTKHLRLPIQLLDYDKLTTFILQIKKDIEHELQVSDEKTR